MSSTRYLNTVIWSKAEPLSHVQNSCQAEPDVASPILSNVLDFTHIYSTDAFCKEVVYLGVDGGASTLASNSAE